MPLISQFYGILIYIYGEAAGDQHNPPRFRANYADCDAVFDLDGNIISGELPVKKRKLIEVWCDLRRDELHAAWIAWNIDKDVIKIDGLR